MLNIDADTFMQSMDHAQAIEALRRALLSDFDPNDDPPRLFSDLSAGQFLFMPAEVGKYCGYKALTITPGNSERNLPRIQGTYFLADATTHTPLATMDGIAMTNVRTPALSLAGVYDPLRARHGQGVNLVVFGVGPQGLFHVDAAAAVVPINQVTVAVRSAGRGAEMLAELDKRGLSAAEAVVGSDELRQAVRSAGLVVTATAAAEPLFDAADIADDAVITAVGSHEPDRRELPGELMGRSTVIVESHSSAKREAGDVVMAVEEGQLDFADTVEFKAMVQSGGTLAVEGKPVIFKTCGMSWEDLVVAAALYETVSGVAATAEQP